jgi:hypothetical protein
VDGRSGAGVIVASAAEHPEVVLDALHSHLPLTLLMDIAADRGPDSEAIARAEGGDAGWLAPPS